MLDRNTSGARRGDGLTTAEQFRFKVTVNNAGEILTFYTTTTSINNAMDVNANNAKRIITRLEKI